MEIAFGLGADFDPSRGAIAVRGTLYRALVSAVQQRADLESTDQAIGNRDVLAGPRRAESVRSFENDGIVVRALTLEFEMRTLRQESTSIPSRLVSIMMLSIVKLSTPVARIPKWPPVAIEISRSVTL